MSCNRRTPSVRQEKFKIYGEKVTNFFEWCKSEGISLSFHHHMGTAVETEKDIDYLMHNTDETVGLLFDPGHMAFAGGKLTPPLWGRLVDTQCTSHRLSRGTASLFYSPDQSVVSK